MIDLAVVEGLETFIRERILEGEEIGLTATTPLLDLGILNSMEILSLIAFIESRFRVAVPPERILADNFKDVQTIAGLVTSLGGATA
ncbi:MAG TPA: acyl carrier protein [Thermoanaerobaculia bacterium]|jgi:acyl carrier protein|nr:acyl carrier protein [Thermoanaerobaculia bacterium]